MIRSDSIVTYEFRNASGPAGYQTFTVDWAAGIIRGRGEGFWSMEMATHHFQNWVDCVREIQRSGRRVRVLADLRDSQTQARDVADFLGRALETVYGPHDRIAMVVANPLVKMQMRRLLTSELRQCFVAIDDAEQWLASFRAALPLGT